ncbi:hypothetical protein EDB86DRAFT_3250452 [Lactarius hatsudake]|nr:hypothetical protein EDB86DRAFT_3250452 [Lactarius hatsudake]
MVGPPLSVIRAGLVCTFCGRSLCGRGMGIAFKVGFVRVGMGTDKADDAGGDLPTRGWRAESAWGVLKGHSQALQRGHAMSHQTREERMKPSSTFSFVALTLPVGSEVRRATTAEARRLKRILAQNAEHGVVRAYAKAQEVTLKKVIDNPAAGTNETDGQKENVCRALVKAGEIPALPQVPVPVPHPQSASRTKGIKASILLSIYRLRPRSAVPAPSSVTCAMRPRYGVTVGHVLLADLVYLPRPCPLSGIRRFNESDTAKTRSIRLVSRIIGDPSAALLRSLTPRNKISGSFAPPIRLTPSHRRFSIGEAIQLSGTRTMRSRTLRAGSFCPSNSRRTGSQRLAFNELSPRSSKRSCITRGRRECFHLSVRSAGLYGLRRLSGPRNVPLV